MARRKLKTTEEVLSSEKQGDARQYKNLLQFLVAMYERETDYFQRVQNKFQSMEKNTAIGEWPKAELSLLYAEPAQERKQKLENFLEKELRNHPDYAWLSEFPGIGPVSAAYLLTKIDIEKCNTLASFKRFCGIGVRPDGTSQRMKKGEKRDYCARIKSVMLHYIGQRTLLQGGGDRQRYRDVYDSWLNIYAERHPDKKQGIRSWMARRKMMNVYARELWMTWRRKHDLPISDLASNAYNNDENRQPDAPRQKV
jgi:hypothetical protein